MSQGFLSPRQAWRLLSECTIFKLSWKQSDDSLQAELHSCLKMAPWWPAIMSCYLCPDHGLAKSCDPRLKVSLDFDKALGEIGKLNHSWLGCVWLMEWGLSRWSPWGPTWLRHSPNYHKESGLGWLGNGVIHSQQLKLLWEMSRRGWSSKTHTMWPFHSHAKQVFVNHMNKWWNEVVAG